MVNGIVIWGTIAFLAAFLAGIIANNKNLNWSFWASTTFLFPPLILALLLKRKNLGPPPRRPTLDQLDARDDRVM